ncbi:MAG: acyl-CoA dehydrogenase family protein [Pseudomonadota bacterium]|nr:acyl-CoA dehydrogenase family protein [Pseudomonadota bacterium]
MPNFYDDNEDLRWYVERGVDWDPLVRLTEYEMKAPDAPASVEEAVSGYRDILELVGGFVGDEVAPRWKELLHAHPRLVEGEVVEAPVVREVVEKLGQLGLFGINVPRELGGMNAPLLLFQLTQELIARADTSVCAHVGFHGGIAMAALLYSVLEGTTTFTSDPPRIVDTRFRELIEEIVAGRAWGSMDITEPGAGSDMAALRTRGELLADGTWVVTGQKVFITSGHGRWHFVIARTEDLASPNGADDAYAGLKGLSLFLVPAWDWGPGGATEGQKVWRATFDGVEEKLGHTASATVSISFERSPAFLVGERGRGFQQMLVLMNNARIGVGFECLGVAEAAWRAAKAYAATRPSMGKTIDRHEMIAEILEDMQTDIQGIRALAVSACWHEEVSQKVELVSRFLPLDPARKAALEAQQRVSRTRSRALTPLLKWLASERCVAIARQAIQVHGGSGYIVETGVERLLRDAMVFPIYEGTSQIQGLMVMKDTLLGVVKDPGGFLRDFAAAQWTSLTGDPLARRVAGLRLVALRAVRFLLLRLTGAKARELPLTDPGAWKAAFANWDPKRDFALAMLHAERLTSLLVDVAVADALLLQVERDPARADVLVRWLERAEPRARWRYDEIVTTGPRLLAILAASGAAASGAASTSASPLPSAAK